MCQLYWSLLVLHMWLELLPLLDLLWLLVGSPLPPAIPLLSLFSIQLSTLPPALFSILKVAPHLAS